MNINYIHILEKNISHCIMPVSENYCITQYIVYNMDMVLCGKILNYKKQTNFLSYVCIK